MPTYNYDACDSCKFAQCVFDDNNLTKEQQDKLCPAVISIDESKVKYRAWRREKLKLIQAALAERGEPIKLSELPQLVDVPFKLIKSWRYNFMEAELVKSTSSHTRIALITSVSLSRIQRPVGIQKAQRAERLAAITKILNDCNSLIQVSQLSQLTGIKDCTIHRWIGNYLTGHKRRISIADGRQREIMFIDGIIKKNAPSK